MLVYCPGLVHSFRFAMTENVADIHRQAAPIHPRYHAYEYFVLYESPRNKIAINCCSLLLKVRLCSETSFLENIVLIVPPNRVGNRSKGGSCDPIVYEHIPAIDRMPARMSRVIPTMQFLFALSFSSCSSTSAAKAVMRAKNANTLHIMDMIKVIDATTVNVGSFETISRNDVECPAMFTYSINIACFTQNSSSDNAEAFAMITLDRF